MKTEHKFLINEIFYSLQGEGRWAGRAAIFIRFSGCNLKCPFCDTEFDMETLSQYDAALSSDKEEVLREAFPNLTTL